LIGWDLPTQDARPATRTVGFFLPNSSSDQSTVVATIQDSKTARHLAYRLYFTNMKGMAGPFSRASPRGVRNLKSAARPLLPSESPMPICPNKVAVPAARPDLSAIAEATLVESLPQRRERIIRRRARPETAYKPAGNDDDNLSQDQSNGWNTTKHPHQETSPTTNGRVRFACPFYKYDPEVYRDCRRFGLSRVKDVKQHLMRKHHQPHCLRCYQIFPSQSLLESHLRSHDACERNANPPPDFISSAQWDQLRGYPGRGKPVEQQWVDIWNTLFPAVPPPSSPYESNPTEECLSRLRSFWRKQRDTIIDEVKDILRGSTRHDSAADGSGTIVQQERHTWSKCEHNTHHVDSRIFDLFLERFFSEFERTVREAPSADNTKARSEVTTLSPPSNITLEASSTAVSSSDWPLPADFDFGFGSFAQLLELDSSTSHWDSILDLSTDYVSHYVQASSRSQDSLERGEDVEALPSIIPTQIPSGIADRAGGTNRVRPGGTTGAGHAAMEFSDAGDGKRLVDCADALPQSFSPSGLPATGTIDDGIL
jgi:hypothetical protein